MKRGPDVLLIERVFEPAAAWAEGLFGITHWQLARFFLLLWVVAGGFWAMGKGTGWFYALYGVELIIATGCVLGTFLFERLQGKNGKNPMKHDMCQAPARWMQLAFTALCLALPPWGFADIGTFTYTGWLFFACCDRIPPKEIKLWGTAHDLG